MRRTHSLFVAVTFLLAPGVVAAQQTGGAQTTQPAPTTAATDNADITTANFFEVIARGTHFSSGSDEARFERYRDLRNGGTLDVFRYNQENQTRHFTVRADHVG